jgi:phosphate transport system permease protein
MPTNTSVTSPSAPMPPEALRRPGAAASGPAAPRSGGRRSVNLKARGEPFLWGMGGALSLGILMILGFVLLIVWNGLITFYPKPLRVVHLKDGTRLAGEPTRGETYKPPAQRLQSLSPEERDRMQARGGLAHRTLYRIGNYDFYNEDFRWVSDYQVERWEEPREMVFVERVEWGPFVGVVQALTLGDATLTGEAALGERLHAAQAQAASRRARIRRIERGEIGAINHRMEKARLALRAVGLQAGKDSAAYRQALERGEAQAVELDAAYARLAAEAAALKSEDARYTITLADINGREKVQTLSEIVRIYPANALNLFQRMGVYASRWREFLTAEPREANTEGGVLPAIFGTFVMTVLMALAVAPFGVMAALYLREYARQGRLVSAVRICVNNLAGVPSIVYGVFGLGFFAYVVGAGIDQLFYPERLPNPTFGTGGLLWASLTLALLTVPVVIVATEEALAAVPQSLREGSLACGASKWQTIKYIVLPKALPGIMTGLILAMARGAGEVAPLMLVGVVKLAPELPIDQYFPFLHLERSFMHLGFHIFDVGFQSRNSEAGKPMVFVTTLLLITLVVLLNATAIFIRNRLKRKYYVGHF